MSIAAFCYTAQVSDTTEDYSSNTAG